MKAYIVLPEGRIAYQQYGDGSQDIIMFHGLMGSSWLSNDRIEVIQEHDVRCIVLERPGYGDSSSIPMQRVADWSEIIVSVIDTLKIKDAIAVGCSAGAVYAYASAFFAPQAISKVWILDGVPAVYLDRIIRHYPAEAREAYAKFFNDPQTQTQDYYVASLDSFLATLPEDTGSYLHNSLTDARANRCFGPAQESRLQIIPWGFDPAEINQPITLWHAERDRLVPYSVAPEMADILKNATLMTADPNCFDENASDMDIHISSQTHGFLHLLNNR
jgi:pimeloyl-ACP methyl ester carboxylesterase